MKVQFSESIQTAEFSASDPSLLCIAGFSRVAVFTFHPKDLSFSESLSFYIGSPSTSISWSPSKHSPRILVASEDLKIRVFDVNPTNSTPPEVYMGHTEYINAVAYNLTDSNYFASVSDDKTLRIWPSPSQNSQQLLLDDPVIMHLNSPAISLQFHSQNSSFILFAERDGGIRLLDWKQCQIMFSVYPCANLSGVRVSDCCWNPVNPKLFAVVVGSKWLVYNLGKFPIHLPQSEGDTQLPESSCLRWSPAKPSLFAVASDILNQDSASSVKVVDTLNLIPQVITGNKQKRISHLTWHPTEPLLAGCYGDQLLFWKV
ncbi:Nucleoporin Nup37 [Nowakowskiella sp. JEL0407]|nr:Nucleoporin Nup37 [Nowakowskiella sp. JEL0407]